ncbi:hypothetical protein JQ594_28385 [Bradyrhizobium manausense]|uniref:hypothetical protein n=1 Tax=Bradyrhizobium manausense TaxID=989370 RepID=UPI001BA9B4DA|nr:hypothetical protein [Bradyrhizobium manausense]MBR0689861.1 hypothetical protein [Bradyrhizobium manausense]
MIWRVLIDGIPFTAERRSAREITLRPLQDDYCLHVRISMTEFQELYAEGRLHYVDRDQLFDMVGRH